MSIIDGWILAGGKVVNRETTSSFNWVAATTAVWACKIPRLTTHQIQAPPSALDGNEKSVRYPQITLYSSWRMLPFNIAELVLIAFLRGARGRATIRTCSLHQRLAKYDTTNTLPKSICTSISSFLMELLPLFRLTSVCSPALFLLVSAHACSQCDVNAWRCGEAEALCHLDEVEFMHIKDRPQTVGGIGH